MYIRLTKKQMHRNFHKANARIIKTNQITRIFLFEINRIYFLVCSQPFQEMKESNPSHGELAERADKGTTVKKDVDETFGGIAGIAERRPTLNELWEAQNNPEARNSKT